MFTYILTKEEREEFNALNVEKMFEENEGFLSLLDGEVVVYLRDKTLEITVMEGKLANRDIISKKELAEAVYFAIIDKADEKNYSDKEQIKEEEILINRLYGIYSDRHDSVEHCDCHEHECEDCDCDKEVKESKKEPNFYAKITSSVNGEEILSKEFNSAKEVLDALDEEIKELSRKNLESMINLAKANKPVDEKRSKSGWWYLWK